eukprot:2328484-Pleurochrysis_carterae.AAC.1
MRARLPRRALWLRAFRTHLLFFPMVRHAATPRWPFIAALLTATSARLSACALPVVARVQ